MKDENTLNQEGMDQFLMSFASALLSWQPIEHNLFLIFNFLAGPHKTPAVLSAIYYTSGTVKPQLKMVDAVAKVVLKDNPYLAEWENLERKISNSMEKRNYLAHFSLTRHSSKDKESFFLKPSMFNIKAHHERDYGIESINAWRESFVTLENEMSTFLDNLPNELITVKKN